MQLVKLLKIAAQHRLLIIALQYVANCVLPDHDANVFTYPPTEEPKTYWDNLVWALFGGLTRWDGQYFMHIALYGYTYENTLAFFPLLPVTVHYLAKMFQFHFLSFESQVLLTFVLFNFIVFMLTTLVLYKLTQSWFGRHVAEASTLLFCLNPASIFFSAAYTECLFAFLTFSSIYCTWRLHFNTFLVSGHWLLLSCITITLSTLTRANGLLNIGFLVYFFARNLRNHLINDCNLPLVIKLIKLACNLVTLILSIGMCALPFVLLQFHHHSNFCVDNDIELPQEVTHQAALNNYILAGRFANQSWCDYKFIPMPYSYVQDRYWHVGFLEYYQLKQIPNFLLAFPVVYVTLTECVRFFCDNKPYLIHLGIFKSMYYNYFGFGDKAIGRSKGDGDKDLLFVCVVHALLLCLFCVFFVHIQVSTRMLFSASPAIYWFCCNKNKTFIKLYCFSYFFIGTVLFSNFLPWT